MGHCQPARHNNRQLTAYEKVLLFSGLTIAGSCGELGELVSEGLIIRLSGVRVPVGPPNKKPDHYIVAGLFCSYGLALNRNAPN